MLMSWDNVVGVAVNQENSDKNNSNNKQQAKVKNGYFFWSLSFAFKSLSKPI